MPLWLLVLGGGALALWLASKVSVGVSPVPGAPKYTISAPAAFYLLDPSTSQGAVPAGQLPQGATVYATAVTPVLSSDQSYELVNTSGLTIPGLPGVGVNNAVWIATAYLSQA